MNLYDNVEGVEFLDRKLKYLYISSDEGNTIEGELGILGISGIENTGEGNLDIIYNINIEIKKLNFYITINK